MPPFARRTNDAVLHMNADSQEKMHQQKRETKVEQERAVALPQQSASAPRPCPQRIN